MQLDDDNVKTANKTPENKTPENNNGVISVED